MTGRRETAVTKKEEKKGKEQNKKEKIK